MAKPRSGKSRRGRGSGARGGPDSLYPGREAVEAGCEKQKVGKVGEPRSRLLDAVATASAPAIPHRRLLPLRCAESRPSRAGPVVPEDRLRPRRALLRPTLPPVSRHTPTTSWPLPAGPPRHPTCRHVHRGHGVGSRGDIQPFIPIGRRLAERHLFVATRDDREFRPMCRASRPRVLPPRGEPTRDDGYIVKTGVSILPTRLDQLC